MKPLLQVTKLASLALLCFATWPLAPQAHAARYDISITADGFSPEYLEVTVGDRVYWWNEDYDFFDYHSTRSYSYPWSSGPINVDYGVYLDTTKTGTYDYVDDWGYSGTGTLVIKPYAPPKPPTLSQPVRLADGSFQCTVGNLVSGNTFYVQASSDLVNWITIYSTAASGPTATYVDPDSKPLSQRFYRAFVNP